MRSIKTLPLLTALAASLPAQWNQQATPNNPSARRAGAMAFYNNTMVLYGGLSATPSQALADTWTYNGAWTASPASAPARWGHRMVTDTANNRVVTFGGRSPTINSLSNETVVWNGSSWSPIATANAPSPRFLYGMCYDQARNVVVLFGGRNLSGPNNETWEFDGTDWTQRTPANAPAAREEMGMVYDASRNVTVLFGGCDESTGTIYGDTWEYDGFNWTETTPAISPSARFRGMCEYDSARIRTIYYGGFDGTDPQTETWEYAGNDWVLQTTAVVPTTETEALSGYDPIRKRFVIFGGFGGAFLDETWEYAGDTSGTFTLYGQGCDTAAGTPTLSGSVPNIGTTLQLDFGNLGGSDGVIVVLGLSNTTWNALPLPFDLAGIGLPGCGLLASADLLEFTLAGGGTAQYGLPIPNQINLVNEQVYCQGVLLNLFPNLVFNGATRGGRAVIGQ